MLPAQAPPDGPSIPLIGQERAVGRANACAPTFPSDCDDRAVLDQHVGRPYLRRDPVGGRPPRTTRRDTTRRPSPTAGLVDQA